MAWCVIFPNIAPKSLQRLTGAPSYWTHRRNFVSSPNSAHQMAPKNCTTSGIRTTLKKLSPKQRLRLLLLQQYVIRRHIKANRSSGARTTDSTPFRIFTAPEEFGLYNNSRNTTIDFIKSMKRHVQSGARKVLIDFSNTKRFCAEGTLYFYAEIDRLLDYYKNLNIKCRPPLNDRASQVLQQIGFYERIGSGHRLEYITKRLAQG